MLGLLGNIMAGHSEPALHIVNQPCIVLVDDDQMGVVRVVGVQIRIVRSSCDWSL
jgi:hypothetical protein